VTPPRLPRLYAIADAAVLSRHQVEIGAFAEGLHQAGVTLLQWRHKSGSPQQILNGAAILRKAFAAPDCTLIMNDRADLCVLANFDGVHVGQGDLPPDAARKVIGNKLIGISTHTDAQVREAALSAADYIAIGPVFSTGTKLDAAPVVGLDGVRRARALTNRPLVAIGGITRQNARSVIDAGADSIAVISALFAPGEPVEKVARDFLDLLR
jgi:thiamine-phosphate pyrophosphorylase